jgi:hypothetical protein
MISLLIENQNYLEMVQPIVNFYQKYPFLSKSNNQSIDLDIKSIRLALKRNDIITFYLSYWRMFKAWEMFFNIASNSLPDDEIQKYISPLVINIPFKGRNKELDSDNSYRDEQLKMAFADASKIAITYLNHLKTTRGETAEKLANKEILPRNFADYLNGNKMSSPPAVGPESGFRAYQRNLNIIKDKLVHYININQYYPLLNGYQFYNKSLDTVFDELAKKEAEFQINTSAIREDELTDRVTPLIKFNDGFVWFDLNASTSSDEADMMGHCCTDNRTLNGGTVYSLRKVFKRGNAVYHDAHVTVMVKDKVTYEIKGRGNQKPSPKYYKHLIALLKSPLIRKMEGGGYAPENNFMLSDLPNEDQKKLLKLKPNLISIIQVYLDSKVDSNTLRDVKNEIEYIISDIGGEITDIDNSGFTVAYDIDIVDVPYDNAKKYLSNKYLNAKNIIDLVCDTDALKSDFINLNKLEKFQIPTYKKILRQCFRYVIDEHDQLYLKLLEKGFSDKNQMILPNLDVTPDRSEEMASNIMQMLAQDKKFENELFVDRLLEAFVTPLFKLIALPFYNELLSSVMTSGSNFLNLDAQTSDLEYRYVSTYSKYDLNESLSETYGDLPLKRAIYLIIYSSISYASFIDRPQESSFDNIIQFFNGTKITNNMVDYARDNINSDDMQTSLENMSNKLLEILEINK